MFQTPPAGCVVEVCLGGAGDLKNWVSFCVVQGVEASARMAGRAPFNLVRGSGTGTWLILIFSVCSALVDWRIAEVWHWPAGFCALWLVATIVLVAAPAGLPGLREAAAVIATVSLYAVPILGGIVRWHLSPASTLIGDGSYQIQLARNVLLSGRDPYGFDYSATGLERAPWNQPFPNPALHHLDYWPGTIVLPLPLHAFFQWLFGWWDERLWLLVAGVALWVSIRKLFPGEWGRVAAAVLFLLPGHSLLAVLGDNDLPMLALVVLTIAAACRGRFLLAGLCLGLAIATKQTTLIVVPLLVAFAMARGLRGRSLILSAGVSAAAVLALLLPFVAWNPPAFITDTISYNLGSGREAYPIQGLGLSAWLLHTGVIHGARDPFPFVLIQAPVLLLITALGIRHMWARPRPAVALVWCGLAWFGFLFLNRFFQPTYLLLSAEVVLTALLVGFPRSPAEHALAVASNRAA